MNNKKTQIVKRVTNYSKRDLEEFRICFRHVSWKRKVKNAFTKISRKKIWRMDTAIRSLRITVFEQDDLSPWIQSNYVRTLRNRTNLHKEFATTVILYLKDCTLRRFSNFSTPAVEKAYTSAPLIILPKTQRINFARFFARAINKPNRRTNMKKIIYMMKVITVRQPLRSKKECR